MLKHVLPAVTMIFIIILLMGCVKKDSVPPTIIDINPKNGAQDVDPSIKEISVTFNEPMMDKSWSWSFEDKDKFPQMTGQPSYSKNNTKNILPVKLEPDKEYVIWLNTAKIINFKDIAGNPLVPYKYTFKTQ